MKNCKYCGAPLDDDSQFCMNCGKKIEPQGKTCPRCRSEVEDDSAFCAKCGMKLDAQAITPVDIPQVVIPATPSQEVAEEIVYEWEEEKDKKWWYIIGGIVVTAFLVIGGYFFLKHNNESVSSPNIGSKTIALKGSINKKFGFTMKLHFEGNEIEGTEHYDSQPKDANLIIKGSKGDNGTILLYEYDGKTKAGTFSGTIENTIFSGTFTNPKGKTFPFTADVRNESNISEAKEKDMSDSQLAENDDEFAFDAWSGKIMIYGGIYRNCQSLCMFDLEKTSKDRYTGKIHLLLGGEDEMERFSSDCGMIEGKVRGKITGNMITIVLDEYNIDDDTSGHFKYSEIKSGQQIFRLTYNKGNYSAKPIGKMEYFFDGVTDETRIYKK